MFSSFGEVLKSLRKHKKVSQQQLAEKVGVHSNTISGWERGNNLPDSKGIVLEIARQLHLDERETRELLNASLTARSSYWYMPYVRNPFFTGREDILQQLHDALTKRYPTIPSSSYAISGLGGIGKTQTAIEYAYRYANNYEAVFWISAETYETIVSSMIAIAAMLNLPEKQEQEQEKVVTAVIRWLISHNDWLLIFDNVEDVELVKRILPAARHGSLLFTSRRQALGLAAQTLDLEQMTQEDGMFFLLYRARLLAARASLHSLAPKDIALAQEIVIAMDGLPLALDQAGAYIEATQCSLDDYLQHFRSYQLRLLNEHASPTEHPLSVARTFLLAFERVRRNNLLAAEILIICAFLAPEGIPEAFFTKNAAQLGPTFAPLATDPLLFDTAIKELLVYSLLRRDASTHTVTLHRLVQAVLRESLAKAVQRTWIARVIDNMVQLFPAGKIHADYWPTCEQLLPHALVCLPFNEPEKRNVAQHITLLNRLASYLLNRGRFAEAEPLYEQALHQGECMLGPGHPLVVETLYGLAKLYWEQGKGEQAESLFQHALQICEQVAELENTQASILLNLLNILGILSAQQSKYEQAELFFRRALQIGEQALGAEHLHMAIPAGNLANLYKEQKKYEQAESLFQRALQIEEQVLGSEHVTIPTSNLANLYKEQKKYEQAESLFQRALQMNEHTLGPEHPQIIYSLQRLAELYAEQGKYKQAESLFQRILQMREQALGPKHPYIAHPLYALAEIYRKRKEYKQAELFYQRALHVREQTLGPEHFLTTACIQGLTQTCQELGQVEAAMTLEDQDSESEVSLLCACGCGHMIDTSRSRGVPRRFFSPACKQRFYRNASRQRRNAITEPTIMQSTI